MSAASERGPAIARGPRRLAAWIASLAVLCAPVPAVAAGGVRLEYVRGPGAARCPGPSAFRARVVRRLGRDPFSPAGARRLRVRIAADGASRVARLTLVDGDGRVVGARRLVAGRCDELVRAAALAVAIALETVPATAPPAPAAPRATAPAATTPPVRAAPATSPLARSAPTTPGAGLLDGPPAAAEAPVVQLPPRHFGLGFHVTVGARLGSLPALGPSVGAGADLDDVHASGSFDLTGDLPESEPIPGGGLVAWSIRGTVRGCGWLAHVDLRADRLGLCAFLREGLLTLRGQELVKLRTGTLAVASVGLGLEFDRRLGRGGGLRFFADVGDNVIRAVARDARTGSRLWETPPVCFTFGVEVALFP